MQKKDSTQKLGKGFGYIAWTLALGALTYFFTGVLDKQEFPNQQLDTNQTNAYKEVILKDNRANHYIFTGKINQVNVTFLVDTGATDVAMSESLADQLNLIKVKINGSEKENIGFLKMQYVDRNYEAYIKDISMKTRVIINEKVYRTIRIN